MQREYTKFKIQYSRFKVRHPRMMLSGIQWSFGKLLDSRFRGNDAEAYLQFMTFLSSVLHGIPGLNSFFSADGLAGDLNLTRIVQSPGMLRWGSEDKEAVFVDKRVVFNRDRGLPAEDRLSRICGIP